MVIVMAFNIMFGKLLWGLDYASAEMTFKDGKPTDKGIHFTILFNTFVFMQLFNMMNARIINPKSLNIFSHLFSNLYFPIVLLGAMCLQIAFVNYGGLSFQCAPLDSTQHSACILWGASTLVVSTALKLTPAHWVDRLPIKVDENKGIDPNDKLMAAYSK